MLPLLDLWVHDGQVILVNPFHYFEDEMLLVLS